jgi:hypothetical protein
VGIFSLPKIFKKSNQSNRSVPVQPQYIDYFGDLNYNPDNINAYVSYDDEDEQEFYNYEPLYNIGRSIYDIPSDGGIYGKMPYAPFKKKQQNKTDVEKALTAIAYAQQDLRNAGVDVPKPDTANAPKRNILEKLIFDPISFLQYGIAGGVKNLADDDEDTTFWQGLGRGFAAGFSDKYADYRTSWRDVLQTMIDNPQKAFNRNFLQSPKSDFVQAMKNNPSLHKEYIDRLEENVKSGKAGEYDKILFDYLKGYIDLEEAQQRWEQWFDPNKPFTLGWFLGLAGDIFLDPMNLVDGWIKSAKVILGGKKIISGSKVIGGLDEAVDVVKTLDLAADSADVVKTARDLLGKTTKKLGYLDDFEGLTVGIGKARKTIIPAEKLAQFGDWSKLSKLGDKISDAGKAIGDTKVVSQLRKAFGGGKYGDYIRAAKANPEEALKNIGYIDFLKKSKGKHKKAIEPMNNIYQEFKKKIHDVDPKWDSLITKMREETDEVAVESIKKVLVDNPEYLSEIEKIKSTTKAGITRYENLIKKYSEQIELLKEAGATKQAAEALSEYTKLSKQLDEMKETYGALSKYYTGSSEIPFEDFVTKKYLQDSNFAKEIGDTGKKAVKQIVGEPPTYEEFMKREGKLLEDEFRRTKLDFRTGFRFDYNEYKKFTRAKYDELVKRYVPLSKSDAKLQEQIRNAAKVLGLELDDDYFKNTPIAKQREYQKQLAKEVAEYNKYTRMLQRAKESGLPATEAQIKYIEDILNRSITRDYLKKKGYKLHNMTPDEIAELKNEIISQRLAKYKQQGGKAKAMEALYNYKKNITAKNKENLMRQAVNRPIQELSADLPDDLSDIAIESKQIMKGDSKTLHKSARAVEPSTLERIESLYNTLKKHGFDKDVDTGIIDAIKDPNSHISVSEARKELGGLISEYNKHKPFIQAKDLIERATKAGFDTGVSEDVLKQLNEGTLSRKQAEELVENLTQLRSKTKNFSLKKATDKQMNWYQTMLNRLNSEEIAEWNAKYPWSKIKQNDDPVLFHKAANELQDKLVKSGRWKLPKVRTKVRPVEQFYDELKTTFDKLNDNKTYSPQEIVSILRKSGATDEKMKWLNLDSFIDKKTMSKGRVSKKELVDFIDSEFDEVKKIIKKEIENLADIVSIDDLSKGTNRVFHVTSADLEEFVDYKGNLILTPSDEFGVKTTTRVPFTDSVDTAKDYATKIKGANNTKIFSIDKDYLEKNYGLRIENGKEIVYNGKKELIIPKDKWQVANVNDVKNEILNYAEDVADDVSFKPDDYAPTFYYKSRKILEEKKFSKGNPADVKKMLSRNGVKAEEMKWLDIDTFLDEKAAKGEKVTRAELDDWIKNHDLQIEERVLNKSGIESYLDGDTGGGGNPEFYRNQYRYKDYSTYNGENYREVLFVHPDTNYKSAHWDDDGVIAHARLSDYTDADGNKVLFVEEIQSDLHQAGRKLGYIDRPNPLQNLLPQDEQHFDFTQYLREINSVVDAPFRDTWNEYVMKRLIRYAAENNYDKIALTNSDIQVKFYSEAQRQGMKDFYDIGGKSSQNIPKFLDKYTKKWGGKVTPLELDTGILGKPTTHASIDITPEMKQSILYEGQPMFYQAVKSHVPGSKKPYQITIGNYTYGSSVDKIGRHHFDTPLGKIVIDDRVKPENVTKFLDELQSLPDEVKAAMKNSTIEITDTKLIQEVAGVRKEIFAHNIGRDNIRIYVTDKAPPRSLMEHELAHNIPSHKVNNLQRTMFNEGQKLTDEAVAEVREALRESGLVSMKIDDDFDEFLKRGYISRYPVSLLDYAGDTPTQESLRLAAKENTAELAALVFHDNPNVSKVIQKHFPESSKALYEEFITLGSKNLVTDRTRSIVPTIQERLDRLQEIIDTLTPDELKKARSVRDFQKKLDGFYQKLAEYKQKQDLIDAGEIAKLVDSSIPPVVEKEIIEKTVKRVPRIELDPNVPEEILEVQEELTNWMRHFAEEEELGEEFIELAHEYVPHIINRSKLKRTKKGREYLKSIGLLDAAPFNFHSLHRKYKGTIEKLNQEVFEQYGIDNAFETEISRIFFQRALDHERFMYDKNNFEALINFFGEESVDLSKIKKRPGESNRAFIKRVSEQFGIEPNYKSPDPLADMKRRYSAAQKQKLSSGEYVLVRPVSEWMQGDQLKIDHEAFIEYLKTGKTSNKKINELIQELGDDSVITQMFEAIQKAELKSPFIRVDTDMVDFEKILMENPDSKLYIMPRQAYEAYNKIITDEFKQNKNAFLKVYDYITSLFKTNATVLNLPFHITNKVGNNYRMYIEYGSKVFDPKYTKRAIQTLRGTGKFYGRTGAEWLEIAKTYGVIGDDIFTDIPTSLNKLGAISTPKTPLKKLSEIINPLDLKWKPYEVGRKLSSYIEDTDRLITFFIGIENGMSIQGAADVVDKLLFDYSDVTKFETQVMKRIFPFYTWLRKNIPLQLELLAEKPQRYARLNRIMKAFNEEETEIQRMYKPKYIQSDSIHLGDGKYLALNLPVGDMERIFDPREIFSDINPLLKLAIELPANTNVYFDSPIQVKPGAMTKAPAWARLIPDISDSINIVKDTPKGRMVDPRLKYVLESMFSPMKHASDIYSYATGEGTDFSNQRAINALSGIRMYNESPDKLQLRALYDYLKKLKNELQNAEYQDYAR